MTPHAIILTFIIEHIRNRWYLTHMSEDPQNPAMEANPAIRLKNCTGLPRSNLTPGVPFGIVLLHGGRCLMVLTSGQTFC